MKKTETSIVETKHTLLNVLSSNLDFIMLQKGVDIKTLSESTGISLTNLHNIRRGLTNPTLTTLEALANYFNLSVTQLLSSYLSTSQPNNQHVLMDVPIFDLDKISSQDLSKLSSEKFLPVAIPMGENVDQRIVVQLDNNAMHPLYEKGTYFLINFALPLRDGDLVAVKLEGQVTTIRRIFVMGLQMTLFHPVLMKEQGVTVDKDQVKFFGVIEKIIQNL